MADIVDPFDNSSAGIVDPFDKAASTPDQGMLSALGHGALAGATFNFGDELAGVRAAGSDSVPDIIPTPLGPIPARMAQGAYKLAKNWLVGGDPEALAAYEKARDAERQTQSTARSQHPYAYGAGEIAGSIPAMAAMPELGAVKGGALAADIGRGAVTGAEYGTLSGAGEGTDTVGRLEGAATGAVGGGLGGAGGSLLGNTLDYAGKRFVQPAINTVRGWIDPEAEAGRRVASALQKDSEMISAGTAKGMTPAQWVAARQAGEPVTLADLGAGNTQSLLRSAANTSPEGRAMLEKVIEDRFLNQGDRVASDVRGLVAGGANANKTAEDLVADYNKARKPLYKQAYQQGDKQIMSPAIEQMMGSPSFVRAMKGAVSSGQDRAVTEGYGAFNPGVTVTPDGRIVFNRGATGVPQYPNLQYWDSVKRELDDMAGSAMRGGEKGQAGVLGNMSNTLRNELDKQVPAYANARGVAAQFFGANNALEAGQQLAGKKVDPQIIRQIMSKMKPDEQNLFREGYASDWANRVINNISDTRDITKAMFNSPNERERAEAVFGPAGMSKIQARMALETIMDGARRAMGNSTTARQLIEAGLAGGALSGYASGWDPAKTIEGAGAAATARFGAGKFLATEAASGARKLIGKVDATTARNVAKLLTSNDPNDLAQGLRMATANHKIAEGLRRIANTVGVSSGAPQGQQTAAHVVPMLNGPVPASAQNEQQQAPRVGQQ